jgi:hypothetical protein
VEAQLGDLHPSSPTLPENKNKILPDWYFYSAFQVLGKGTVSPDIVFYFQIYKFKSLLLVRPLMVFKFVYFVVL